MNAEATKDEDRISQVDNSQYKQLLEFVIDKALTNEEFTIEEVKDFYPGASDKEISRRLANLCHSRIENYERFQVKPEAFLSYLEFLSIRDSQTTAHKADNRAITAIRIAATGLLLNVLIGFASLTASLGSTSLDAQQLERLDVTQELQSIESALVRANSTGSAERSELAEQLMSSTRLDATQQQELIKAISQPSKLDPTQLQAAMEALARRAKLDDSQLQKLIDAINRPVKLDDSQWKELKTELRKAPQKKTGQESDTPDQKKSE